MFQIFFAHFKELCRFFSRIYLKSYVWFRTRFLDFYGIDYDFTKTLEDGRSPKSGKGWIRNTRRIVGGLNFDDLKKRIGKNSSGIIGFFRAEGIGHVYNIYSTNQAIVFVDLQAGQVLSPNIDHLAVMDNPASNKPFELLIVNNLKPTNYPEQALLMGQKAIKHLLKNVQNKSVRFITKLVPKMYRFGEKDQQGYDLRLYQEKEYRKSTAHPVIYFFKTLNNESIQLWMMGRSKAKDATNNEKLGKTLRIKITINNTHYFFDRYGNMHNIEEIKDSPCLVNDTYIPIDNNPGKKCND